MKKEIFYNIGLVLLAAGIIALVLFKFILKQDSRENDMFRLQNLETITLSDLNENEIKLADILKTAKGSMILFINLDDCFGCIVDGINDLEKIKNTIPLNLCIVVCDNVADVRSWAAVNFERFDRFYVMNKKTFQQHIQSTITPVLVTLVNGKPVKSDFYRPMPPGSPKKE